MPPRTRKTVAELVAEIDADKAKQRDRDEWLDANPHLRRLAELELGDEPYDTFKAQLTVITDHAVAQAIRNQISGQGKSLRALGYVEVADVLGY